MLSLSLSLIESYGYLILRTVFALLKPWYPRMQSTTTSCEPLYKRINCEIGEYPTFFSTLAKQVRLVRYREIMVRYREINKGKGFAFMAFRSKNVA
ncbi:hypothetical protein Hanom_Chr10g00957391 [Helianthus anomalus]